MSRTVKTIVKTEYRNEDLYAALARIINLKKTGKITLHISQGTLGAFDFEESLARNVATEEKEIISLDRAPTVSGLSSP